jgi:hypothetical protein
MNFLARFPCMSVLVTSNSHTNFSKPRSICVSIESSHRYLGACLVFRCNKPFILHHLLYLQACYIDIGVRTSSKAMARSNKNFDLYLASVQFVFRPEQRSSPILTNDLGSCPQCPHPQKKAGIIPQLGHDNSVHNIASSFHYLFYH